MVSVVSDARLEGVPVRAKANDGELASFWQTSDEKVQSFFGDFNAIASHAAASVDDEDEVELTAVA